MASTRVELKDGVLSTPIGMLPLLSDVEVSKLQNPNYVTNDRGEVHDYKLLGTLKQNWWHPWSECSGTGYHKDKPPWLTVWLMIRADNTFHHLFNFIALMCL